MASRSGSAARHGDRRLEASRIASQSPWAGNPPHPDAARQRLLDAAARCIARDGLAATSVASVATEAGVSRPTVYRYFEHRDELVREAFGVAAEGLRHAVLDRISALGDAGEMIVEAIVVAVNTIPADPVLRAIWSSAAVDVAVVGNFTEPRSIAWVRECLQPAIEAAGWEPHDADESVEIVLRLVLSMLITPAPARTPQGLRSFLRRRLLPSLAL